MKGHIQQYKWKIQLTFENERTHRAIQMKGAFNNEMTYWANQIKGLMDWLILEKNTLSKTNERCNEL